MADKAIESLVDGFLAELRVLLLNGVDALPARREHLPLLDEASLLSFPCNWGRSGRKRWALGPKQVRAWQAAYPDLDVLAECKKAHAWLVASPERQKTASGMMRFLVAWLNRSSETVAARPAPKRVPGAAPAAQAVVPEDLDDLCARAGIEMGQVRTWFKGGRLDRGVLYIVDPDAARWIAKHYAAKMGVTVRVGS